MLTAICLAWVGMQLNAPTWYFAILITICILKTFQFGIDMYNKGSKNT